MPIITPHVNTAISIPHPGSSRNPVKDMLLKQFLEGMSSSADQASANKGKMQQLLAGPGIQKEEAQNKANIDLDTYKKMQDLAPNSSAIKAGDLSSGADPTVKNNMTMMKNAIDASKNVNHTYNQTLPKMMDQAQSIEQGLNDLKNPNALTAGQLRTNMIRASGMNRYNEAEGGQLLPKSVQERMSKVLAGLGEDSASVTPALADAAKDFYKNTLDSLKTRHSTVIQNAKSQYPSSILGGQAPEVGGAFDSQLQGLSKQNFDSAPQAPAVSKSPTQVIGDKLRSLFSPASSAPAAPAQPAPARTVSPQDLKDYSAKHGIEPDAAASFLKSKGFQLGE